MAETVQSDQFTSNAGVLGEMLGAFLMPISSGILLGCSFLWGPTHWFAWFGLVPVAAAISKRTHLIATSAGMYCAGLLFNLITTDWIRTLEGGTALSGRSAPDWLLQSELLALFWPLTLVLGRLLVKNWQVPMSLALPAVWMIHEQMLRSLWAFVDRTGWQVYFLGYALIDHHYISQIADLGGVSALSFLAACTSGAAWDLLASLWNGNHNRVATCRAAIGLGMAISLLLFSFGYGAWRISQTRLADGPQIWLMPENILQEPIADLPWQPDGPAPPDILLWSELAYPGPPMPSSGSEDAQSARMARPMDQSAQGQIDARANRLQDGLEELCREFDVPLVIGYTRTDRSEAVDKKFNSAAFVDPKGGLQGSYDKLGLVPWTEFTPWEGLASRKGLRFSHGMSFPVFQLRGKEPGNSHRFAVAICYDVAFPQLFRRYMLERDAPDFFLVCSSERADRTGQMSRHVLNLAKVRAIECRRTLVRNVHLGCSGRIDSLGRLLDESIPALLESPTPLGTIPIDQRLTLYVLWGDWLPTTIICAITILASFKFGTRYRFGRFFFSRARS